MKALTSILCLAAVAASDSALAKSGKTGSPAAQARSEEKGQPQPQGWTGPITTGSGGAPAESPQGQSPPGMQAAPEGSSKKVVAPEK
ncbi:hypothetical protein [Bradyrhizobium sp. SSUT77]|uniref:hypothetical protein n=1 Tax=Bradyrhizobium sp. SSUT77 TaxID=3040603 RepID=UPI002449B5CB|nr:hypothetical protein [Bradyrhizobium sp. SSUT77]MDH2346011.1 hypothetical protein [Bradyrhizobium sp. SSUT77]